ISLISLDASALPALPEPRQSAEIVVAAHGRANDVYLLGGMGPSGDVVRTLGDAFRLDRDSSGTPRWTKLDQMIPDSRGMFRTAAVKGSVWIFGGSIWDGDMSHTGTMPTEILRWDPAAAKPAFVATGKHLPRPRRSFAGAVLGNKFYMVGGLG